MRRGERMTIMRSIKNWITIENIKHFRIYNYEVISLIIINDTKPVLEKYQET